MPDIPRPLNSLQLQDATVVVCAVEFAQEEGDPRARRYVASGLDVLVQGACSVPDELTFAGSGLLGRREEAPLDVMFPSVRLEGRRFFDQRPEPGGGRAVLLVGSYPNPQGTHGEGGAPIEGAVHGGPLAGTPVRPFWSRGADEAIAEALPRLWAFQAERPPLERVERALELAHPLPAIDALRCLTWDSRLAELAPPLLDALLHPARPANVRVEALSIARSLSWNEGIASVLSRSWDRELAFSWNYLLESNPLLAYFELFSLFPDRTQRWVDVADLVAGSERLIGALAAEKLRERLIQPPPEPKRRK